ncbi:MAG: HAD family hydrolase [Elusimicrobiota bacterium]
MNLIALDLDGTLEDSRADMVAAAERVRASLGLAARPPATLAPWVNQGMETLYRNCFDDYIAGGEDAPRLAAVQAAYEADYTANVARQTRLYPGIAEALEALAVLGRLAVVTNKPEKISRRLLQALDVDRWIAVVVGGDTCGETKPSPLMLRTAAQRAGLGSADGRALMIGDTTADIKMGRAFGARTVWCAWGYADSPGERPDHVARSPEELPGIVRSALAV